MVIKKRPRVESTLVLSLTGTNETLLENLYSGLWNMNLGYLSPHLDLKEKIGFTIASAFLKKHQYDGYVKGVEEVFERHGPGQETMALFELIDRVSEASLTGKGQNIWYHLNHFERQMNEKSKRKYSKQNPFRGYKLKERLKRLSSDPEYYEAINFTKEKLTAVPKIFMPEYELNKGPVKGVHMPYYYQNKKMRQDSPENRIKKHAKKCAELLNMYNEYVPFETPKNKGYKQKLLF